MKTENQKPIKELLEFCIINVDKLAGLTSHDVVQEVKRVFNAKRVGHTGTLDPMVTGVLPVLLNRATKLSNYFMKKDKVYVGKMMLHKDISEGELKREMEKFIGKIMQKPPVRSRVKRVLRERIVNKFKIIKKEGRIVEFESDVQAGTYIRKIVSDLGEKIGGAHMIELRRMRAGLFDISNSHTINEVEQAVREWREKNNEEKLRKMLIPAEIVKQLITSLQVKEEAVKGLLNGKPLMKMDLINDKIPNSELFSVFCKDRFIGIYKKEEKEKNEEKDITARPEFVMN